MIPVSKAIKIVKRETGAIGIETVRIENAVGRILAEAIVADSDMPPFDRSQMDGYAVKAKETASVPARLKIVGESAAGHGWHRTLKNGEAIRIMTGAPVPSGADSVQKIELTSEKDSFVTINEPTEKGRYIVKKGAEIRKGERLFPPGLVITDRMIASLAAFGYSRIKVATTPSVSILSTGSEIVAIDKTPGRDQIRNSNSVMLKALAENVGARVKLLPRTGDDLAKLKSRIGQGVGPGNDILVITGGVSVGKYDLTKAALHELGAEIFFEKVRLRPGKPTVFGRLNTTLIFGLPGNPVSSAVTFFLFVRTAILKMKNASETELRTGFAQLTAMAKAAKERETYLPATLDTRKDGTLLATPLRWHGSSDFVGFASAEALVVLGRGETLAAGETARILFL
jgi:molybdopterin molybdotransferase